MTEDLNEILKTCAALRGVSSLPHRTLKEFNWFVQEIIFINLDDKEDEDVQKLKKYHEKIDFDTNDPDALIGWAKLFLEYCKDEYLEGYEKDIEGLEKLVKQ